MRVRSERVHRAEIKGAPQGFGPEAWLNTMSQAPEPEDARQIGLIRARR